MQLNSLIDFLGKSFLSPGSGGDQPDGDGRSRFSSMLSSTLSLLSNKSIAPDVRGGLGAEVLSGELGEAAETTVTAPLLGIEERTPTSGKGEGRALSSLQLQEDVLGESTSASGGGGVMSETHLLGATHLSESSSDERAGRRIEGLLDNAADSVLNSQGETGDLPRNADAHTSPSVAESHSSDAPDAASLLDGRAGAEATGDPSPVAETSNSASSPGSGNRGTAQGNDTPAVEVEKSTTAQTPQSPTATAAESNRIISESGNSGRAIPLDGESAARGDTPSHRPAAAISSDGDGASNIDKDATQLPQAAAATAGKVRSSHASNGNLDHSHSLGKPKIEGPAPPSGPSQSSTTPESDSAENASPNASNGRAPEGSSTAQSSIRAAEVGRQAEHLSDRPFRIWQEAPSGQTTTARAGATSGMSSPFTNQAAAKTVAEPDMGLVTDVDGKIVGERMPTGEPEVAGTRQVLNVVEDAHPSSRGQRAESGRLLKNTGHAAANRADQNGNGHLQPGTAERHAASADAERVALQPNTDATAVRAATDGSDAGLRANPINEAEGRTAPKESYRERGQGSSRSIDGASGQASADGNAGWSSGSEADSRSPSHGHPQEFESLEVDSGDFAVETLDEPVNAVPSVDSEVGSDEPHFTPERAPTATAVTGLENAQRSARPQSAGTLAWLRSILSQSVTSMSLEQGWKVIEMQLDDGQGTMTVKARRDDEKVSISVAFSDPNLRSMAEANASRLEEMLRSEYETDVDFSLLGDGGSGSSERDAGAGASREGAPMRTVSPSDEIVSDERRRAARVSLSGARNEWIG